MLTPNLTLFPDTRAQFQHLRRHNRSVGMSCLQATGPMIGHVDTISVARDHEALRQALGVSQVSWLGLSYGTQVAANYAELFPQQTRAMVLDAALEHSLTQIEQTADEAMAAEDTFNRFLRWCRTAHVVRAARARRGPPLRRPRGQGRPAPHPGQGRTSSGHR